MTSLCLTGLLTSSDVAAQKDDSTKVIRIKNGQDVGGVEISASISDAVVELGDTFEYVLTVSAPSSANVRVLEPPDFRPFSQVGSNQSTQWILRNGVSERNFTMIYRLRTRRLGKKINIAPPVILVDKKKFSPQGLVVKVVKQGEGPKKGLKEGKDKSVFVDASISLQRDPYVGEQIVLQYDLMANPRKIEAQPRPPSEPNLDDFWIEELDDRTLGSQRGVRVGGQYFKQTLLRRYAIYPLEAGEATIDAMTVPIVTGGFMQARKEFELQSEPITLNVKPLPEGAPEDFYEGNVGDWEFHVTSDRLRTRVGRAVTIRISARGTGQASRVKLPEIAENETQYRRSDVDENVEHKTQGGQVISEKSISYSIVPLKEGMIEIPALRFSYFEPSSGEYRTKQHAAIRIEVGAGELPPEPVKEEDAVTRKEAKDQDVMSALRSEIAPLPDSMQPQTLDGKKFYRSNVYKGIVLGLLALMLGLLVRPLVMLFMRRESPAKHRAQVLKESLGMLERASQEESYELVYEAIKLYCSDALGILKGYITPKELPKRLKSIGISSELSDALSDILKESYSARYSRSAEVERSAKELSLEANKVLKAIHKEVAPLLKQASKAGKVATMLLVVGLCGQTPWLVATAHAQSPPTTVSGDIARAETLHKEHKWEEAKAAWDALSKKYPMDADLHYALGTACLQLEELGCSVLALERALLLDPRREDAEKNLDVAQRMLRVKKIESLRGRSQVIEGSEDFFWWDIARKVDPAVMSILLLISTVIVILALLIQPRLSEGTPRDLLRAVGGLALLVVIGTGGALLFRGQVIDGTDAVVLTAESPTLKEGPSEHAAERVYRSPVVPGMRFIKLEERTGWVKLKLPDGSGGWVTSTMVDDLSVTSK